MADMPIIGKKDRRAFLSKNAALPADHPDRLTLEQLRLLGVVTQLTLVFWYRGEEYATSQYIDDEAFSAQEVMGTFVKPFEDAMQKRDDQIGV